MQTLAIFLLSTFCAGAIAWVLVYPYLSGEKEAEKRMLSVARSGVPASKVTSRALKSRLPVAVVSIAYVTSPGYITLLWTERIGQVMLAGSAVWMGIGIAVMRKMINFNF